MKLVIAEKPSVAQSIARVLGVKNKKDGYLENNEYIISWCVGHLIGLAPPDVYGEKHAEKIWRVEHLPILPQKWVFNISKNTKKQYDTLKSLINDKRVSELICATDAGREGELIFRLVYNHVGTDKPFKRLWISSMEDNAIKEGFSSLKDGTEYNNLYDSALCRAKADWLIGMNGTRLFSATYKTLLSVGRVQTPTLAMIVERDEKIKNFIKEKYFTVELDCGFTAISERIDEQGKAEKIKTDCNGKTANVKSITKELKTINPPKLYDLTTLQREANRILGYTAQQTLDYTQALYEKKLVTYPRTDSQFLTDDMVETALNIVEIIQATFTNMVNSDFTPDIKRVINNKKVSDHHAIIPTAEIAKSDIETIPQAEKNILMLISNKMICGVAEKHTYEAVTITVDCKNNAFFAKGKTILQNGWKEVEKNFIKYIKNAEKSIEQEEKVLPELSENQSFDNVTADISEHWTSPPKPYTEDTLLSAMEYAGNADYDEDLDVEKKGLGTPATRAKIIENLVKKEFVERRKKNIVSMEKGIKLIGIVPESIKSAKLTADWEMSLQKIAQGKYSDVNYMNEINEFVKKLIEDNLTIQSENIFTAKKTDIGSCPQCRNNIIKGKYGYYCESKCGMNIAKVYGKELTESQLNKLLSGKKISFTNNGKKTTVLPEFVPYSFKKDNKEISGFQWKTEANFK